MSEAENDSREPAVGFHHVGPIPEFLRTHDMSLIVTTYQAQRVLVFSPKENRLSMLMRIFERPTGLWVEPDRMAMVTKTQIWMFSTVRDVWDEKGERQPHDLTYVPRRSFVTGDVAGHEITLVGNDCVFINTRFSCLARPSDRYSFEPIWKPRFVTEIVAEDRCHLNGMAVQNGNIRFLSALGETNSAGGWREKKRTGGVLIDTTSGEVMCRGLCMPHSPRIHAGRLWVLESGFGELQMVDPKSGVRETVIRLPAYLRGLEFYDRFAFIGMSQMRETNVFGGLPIEGMYPALKCGIAIVDITSGQLVGMIEFTKGIEELFEVRILPKVLVPHIIGFEADTIQGLFSLPPDVKL